MMMGKTTSSDSFHWKKWIDLQHLERLQLLKCCMIWPSGSRSTEACMLFLCSLRALHRNVTVTCSHDHCWLRTWHGTSNTDNVPFSTLKLREVVVVVVAAVEFIYSRQVNRLVVYFKTAFKERKTKQYLRQDPLDLSFWSFLTFLHHGIEEIERLLLWKFYKKIRRKSWSNVLPKLVACIGFLYKVVHKIGRLRKFNRSRGI